MKVRIIGGLLIAGLLSLQSCEQESKADAYGNFEDDAVLVSSEGMGKLIEFQVEEGQQIEKGQVIALIDTMQFYLNKEVILARMKTIESKANTVENQISVLQEQLDALKLNQKRILKMFDEGAATQKQVDDIDAQVKITQQKIQNIKVQSRSVLDEKQGFVAQIKQIDDLIERNIIKSPINGTILETYAKQGEITAPGKPLIRIQDIETLVLRAYISETQLAEVKLNQEVNVSVDSGEGSETFIGVITWISDKSEFTPKQIQTKNERKNLIYAIKIQVPNKGGLLKIGMPASVLFN